MSVVLPTPEPAVVARFASGDENALVALYRQEYDGLLAAAGESLGSELAHYRGRVAHKAMIDTWQARERFNNPMAFAAFLEEAVKQEAVVQRRKHAALHRRDHAGMAHVFVPGIEDAVKALVDELHAPVVDHATAMEEARATKRAHTKEHVERVASSPKWMLYGIIGVVAVVVILGLQRYLDKAGGEAEVDRALRSDETQALSSSKGQRGALTLRDGTKAAMGSETSLRIPKEFSTTQRTIELQGTATFTVTPPAPGAQALPFAVRAGTTTVTATGTVFTVRHYPEDASVMVMVTEGSVDFKDRTSGTTQAVKAGQAMRFAGGTFSALEGIARDVAMAWTRDSIVFDAAPLKTVVPELVRWFGMNAVLADSSVGDRPVSMRIALSSSGEATAALTKAADLTIAFGKDDRIEFNRAPAAPTKATR